MRRLRARLTYANVMATIAVFVALGGSSYAAISIGSNNVRNNSLTTKDVKNNSLTGKDVKNKSLTAKDFKGSLGGGGGGGNGQNGTNGANGSALAYAHVNSDGSLDAANSKNITSSRSNALNNYYCIRTTVTGVKNVVASLSGPGTAGGEITAGLGDPFTSCPGAVATVETFNATGGGASRSFYINLN